MNFGKLKSVNSIYPAAALENLSYTCDLPEISKLKFLIFRHYLC